MADTILSVENVTVIKHNHKIVEDVSFEVHKGETVALIGPNGAGKTTIFKALLGLIPHLGTVTWEKGTAIGYVPQRLYIEPDLPLTTREFFETKEKSRSKIAEALETVGITKEGNVHSSQNHILQNKLGNLSGGEIQRVLIAWSLLGNPDVLLFDEPTSGVDVVGEETIYSLLQKLKEKKGLTILLISHELEIVYKYATNVICINKEKVCYGPPKLVLDKKTLDRLFGEEVGVYKHEHHH